MFLERGINPRDKNNCQMCVLHSVSEVFPEEMETSELHTPF